MSALSKTILLTIGMLLFCGTPTAMAASLRWVHLGTIDAGLVDLSIDGKIVCRKLPPGKATSWGKIVSGPHTFLVSSEKNPGSPFELQIAMDQKVVIVSSSDKNGDLQCRTVLLEKPGDEMHILNLIPSSIMTYAAEEKKAIFGKGFRVPFHKQATSVTFTDSEGLEANVTFTRVAETSGEPYLAILSSDDDGKPQVSILRDRDSLFETSGKLIALEGELTAQLTVISKRRVPAADSFDPMQVQWDQVDSQMFWLNLMIDRDPCRFEIKGFAALRRMPSGRGSGFVKWPAGTWDTSIVVERTNQPLASGNFTLPANGRLGLISSGGGKYAHRLIKVPGRTRKPNSTAKSRIRFVNALPAGVMRYVVPRDPEPVTDSVDPGKVSKIILLENNSFEGATLDLTLYEKNMVISKIPRIPKIPVGDWVVVAHLDQEAFEKPVLTWVEMERGAIESPPTKIAEE